MFILSSHSSSQVFFQSLLFSPTAPGLPLPVCGSTSYGSPFVAAPTPRVQIPKVPLGSKRCVGGVPGLEGLPEPF